MISNKTAGTAPSSRLSAHDEQLRGGGSQQRLPLLACSQRQLQQARATLGFGMSAWRARADSADRGGCGVKLRHVTVDVMLLSRNSKRQARHAFVGPYFLQHVEGRPAFDCNRGEHTSTGRKGSRDAALWKRNNETRGGIRRKRKGHKNVLL